MEYESADEGRLGKIIVPEGAQGIKVHEPIALLLEEGEDAGTLEKMPSSGAAPQRAAPPIPAEPKTEPAPAAPRPSPPPQAGEGMGEGEGGPRANGDAAPRGNGESRGFASPLERGMDKQAGHVLDP